MRKVIVPSLVLAALLSSCQGDAAPADSDAGDSDQTSSVSCPVQGVWSLQSVTVDGVAEPPPIEQWGQMKVIAASRYAWVRQEGGVMPLGSVSDSIAAYRTRSSGAGTYRIVDSMYIERLEYFSDPQYVGREIAITCPVQRDVWSHAFDWSRIRPGQADSVVHVVETWRRLE